METKRPSPTFSYLAHGTVPHMFLLCWFAYFAANLARLTYTSSMAEIIRAEGFTNAAAGLVSTGFFICYGAGQLISGYLGDYIAPQKMVGFGLAASGVANVAMGLLSSPGAMVAVWCANGLIQATLWTPILRVIAEDFPPETRKRACVNMATTYPAACLLMYAGSAGIIALAGWRWVFFITALLLAAMAVVWARTYPRLNSRRTAAPPPAEATGRAAGKDGGQAKKLAFPLGALALVCCALMVQGVLRDGVTGWVPSYLSAVFAQDTAFAILTTTALPVVNLAGVYAANALHRRLRSETLVSAMLFGAALAAATALYLFGARGYWLSLLCFGIITSCMLGINVMLVSLVPTKFAAFGKVSFIGGLTNAMVYIGSSISTWGFGAVVDGPGWGVLLGILVLCAVAGGVLALAATPFWKRFSRGA